MNEYEALAQELMRSFDQRKKAPPHEEISTAMSKFKMRKGSVHIWPISNWSSDEFFETKQVIYIEK